CDATQRRIVEVLLRDAELSGVGLEGEKRERFNAVQQELAELGTRFSNNVLDATKAFALTLEEPQDAEGLPASLRQVAAQAAREAGSGDATAENGPWRITLDYPSFMPFMSHSRRRDYREQLYRASISRASSGDLDNTPLIARILQLRQEMAALLGYGSFAELSLASKMAPDVAAIESLLEELRQASLASGQQDLEDQRQCAAAAGAPEAADLRHWDLPFWAERRREQEYDFSEEALRPYFPLPRVLDGLFALAERLFGVRIEAADGVPVWHDDVRFFRIRDEQGRDIAAFYLDPYSRPAEKRGGAWMDEFVGRSRLLAPAGQSVRLPVAYLVCNQTPPVGGQPSLMSFTELTTLFHEFGHGLHHMLTTVDYGMAAGINNVDWDAVELPSQFMENWCYHRETLLGMSGHVETGEPLPEGLYEKLCAARHYRAGSLMLRQLSFGLIDLALHHGHDPHGAESAFDLQRRLAPRTSVMPPLPEDRFLCSFGHIFAGGYAAGYYSYKWAEVLSADAFA
ncbi:MAG: M3 family metallopeptidase, partial [Candidatus Tectomicrobia bacterium]|nr:M3 family metallopeptidase [Candidatus Tectomicrobia bacterium]